MRIAHVNNMANIAWQLAQSQKQLGHEAVVFAVYDDPSSFPYDVRVPRARGPFFWNLAMFERIFTFKDFDVLHIHGGIWRTQMFYGLFKRLFESRVLVVQFHGNDARSCNGVHHLRWADVLYHSTQDLGRFLPGSSWLPSPLALPELVPETQNAIPRIGHFPFRWTPGAPEGFVLKGTERIIGLCREAFGPLRTEVRGGVHFFRGEAAELAVMSGRPHEEAVRFMASCDVVIDQFSDLHIYGMAALEAMALGKPAMSNYNPAWFPGSPVVRLGDDAVNQLRIIAADAELRRDLGRRGRAFVGSVHAAKEVAKRTLNDYERAMEYVSARRGR